MRYAVAHNESEPSCASAGPDKLSVEPAAARTRTAAGLHLLCDELVWRQGEIDRLARDGAPSEDLDAALDAWWATVEDITSRPAKTFKAMRSKARAVHTVMLAVGRDRSPEANALLASLLTDLLGEAVQLP
jgi:hypothetical protein